MEDADREYGGLLIDEVESVDRRLLMGIREVTGGGLDLQFRVPESGGVG